MGPGTRRAAAIYPLLPMAELPPVGTVVWMKTHAKPVRARLIDTDVVKGACVRVLLQFDDARYHSMNGGLRPLYTAAFWSALDRIEVAK